MSLDIYLHGETTKHKCTCPECFNEHETESTETLYSANITHNLSKMASHSGLYSPLWEPEILGITKAKELIPFLEEGLNHLLARPGHFKTFNSPNGWGIYDNFVPFVTNYLNACRCYPDATVSVSR